MAVDNTKKLTFSIQIDRQLVAKIDQIADAEDRSRNYIVARILQDYIYKQIDKTGESSQDK